ncbi:MAG: NADH-quinone oxidoreductase subunit A [Acidobacteria bacterium]|jgi:NADH-quinone oxidoreductase subunit A|nr:NADH-quinone oxidoreductase subunit A [Acidobacteriota bacterium]|tara:strand:- start:10354 stop:10710 length:357 start_codon:yes stop_codon:yes gene_type:complete
MGAYLPIALFAVAATVFAVIGLVAGGLIRPAGRDLEGKLEPYECGVEPVRDARQRFSIRFYIVAMLFLIFDVETIFLFPWAVQFKQLALFGFIEMVIFIAILIFGYIYAWKRGALEWV